MEFVLSSSSADETEHIGEKIGSRLKGGEVIELTSDIGGGKTTFVRGLARGAGSQVHVSSPTFKISNVYDAGNLQIHHFDFYRLGEAGIMSEELGEVISNSNNVVVIEWAGVVKTNLPEYRLNINITLSNKDSRQINIKYDDKQSYLVEAIC